MTKLSAHFDSHEFACPCCGVAKVDPALVQLLERIREKYYPQGLRIVSGYRCKKHNDSTPNAAKSSQHMLGKAADIAPRMTVEQARALGAHGVGSQQATGLVVHVDVGPVRRPWRYDASGRVIS